MRTRILVPLVCTLLLVPAAGTAGVAVPPRVVFRATTHTPKVNARWPWSIAVTTAAGRLLPATISVAIVDPFGGIHPVDYGCCDKKFITNVKIKGRFADYVLYPLSSKGFRLTFRVTVKSRLGTRVVNYWVKAQ